MRDVNLIVVMFKRNFKTQRVIGAPALFLHRVLVVGNVVSVAIPPDASRAVGVFTRVDKWLLALVVAGVRLDEVYDVELVTHILTHIGDLEVKPLSVGRGLVVVLKDQVVVVRLANLHYATQVP